MVYFQVGDNLPCAMPESASWSPMPGTIIKRKIPDLTILLFNFSSDKFFFQFLIWQFCFSIYHLRCFFFIFSSDNSSFQFIIDIFQKQGRLYYNLKRAYIQKGYTLLCMTFVCWNAILNQHLNIHISYTDRNQLPTFTTKVC